MSDLVKAALDRAAALRDKKHSDTGMKGRVQSGGGLKVSRPITSIDKSQLKGDTEMKKKAATKSTTKKKSAGTSGVKSKGTSRRDPAMMKKIAKMWDEGKSSAEISDAVGLTDKKSNWPYSNTLGILKSLRKGVTLTDGTKLIIKGRR